MDGHDPAGAAKEAAARQAVELAGAACLIVFAVILQVVQREASDPDFIPQLGARAGLWRRAAARHAEARLARLGIWALAQAERQRRAADAR
jgi:hypothetical protein